MNFRQLAMATITLTGIAVLWLLDNWNRQLVVPAFALITAFALGVAYFSRAKTQPADAPADREHLNLLSTGVILVASETGSIRWANQSACRLLEEPLEALVDKLWQDLRPEAVWRKLGQRLTDFADAEHCTISGELMRKSGDTARVQGRITPDPLQTHTLMVEFVELAGRRSIHHPMPADYQADYRNTLDAIQQPVVIIDSHGRITHPNSAARRELKTNKLTDVNVLEFIAAKDRQLLIAKLKQLQRTQEPQTIEHLELSPGGRHAGTNDPLPAQARLVALPSAPGTALISFTPNTRKSTHKKPEQDNRTSDARFSRIFHSSPDAILIMRDDDSTILDFNAGFTSLLGYSREEAIGARESDLDLWVHRVERERIFKEFRKQKECNSAESKLRSRDGDTVFAELSLRYIEIDGELCVLCISRDVSKRALAEAALKESQLKFQQIFSRTPDGIAIIRQDDLTICDINDAFVSESGYERDQLVDYSLLELDILVNKSVLYKTARLLAKNGHFSNIEMIFKTRQGEHIPALVSATLLEVGEEPCILCIAKDVRHVRATEEQLRVSEERFRGAFENAPIGILLLDMEGRVFQANRFATDLLEYGEKSMQSLHISRLVPTEERSRCKEMLRRLSSGAEETIRAEQRMLRAGGQEIWTNMHVVLQRSREGSPSDYMVQIADITETKVSQQRMERMAFYDILTDLANRRLFYDRLAQVIEHTHRTDRLAALLYLDLDQFKRVNDTLGHEVGDALLKEIAQRLTQSVRSDDTVGRPGGDEFTILLSDISSPSDASLVAEKILNVLQRPITIDEHQLVVTTSIGITIVPTDGTDPTVLMKNADLAMYQAKENGRNNFQFYSEDMNTNATHRLQTEFELRRALERDEFVLFYQPKLRLTDQKIVGVECLLRWQHPERGLLMPAEFMDVAEETGTIVEMGNWVIKTACEAATRLASDNGSPIDTALNISSRQFRDPNLVGTIRKALRNSGLDPKHLEVEITETMLMHDVDAAAETVSQLHDLGVKLAIDDFGTGYSSLSYLKKFPIDTVKVDRSFVMDIPNSSDDIAITSAVIAMAHTLNMQVVAEGVETPEQLEFLLKHKCEFAQGFLFSKAVPLDKVTQLLAPNIRLLRS